MWKLRNVLRRPDDDGSSGGGAAAPAASPASAPAAPAASPAAAPAAPAASPAPAASAPAPAPAPVANAPAAAPAAADDKPAYWPADWRETVSKADEKVLARMQRYASPEAALQALVAAQNRISAGELKPVLGKNPTPEQIGEYRAALGIPETPDKYDLGKDVTVPETEAPLMAKFFAAAHGTHQTPEMVKANVKAWRAIQTEVAEAQFARDEGLKATAEDSLRAEWGPEFRRNVNLINGLLDGAGAPGVVNQLLEARLPDGTKFGNSPDVMKLLVGLALVQNPTGVVVPGGEGNQMQGVETEIEKIEKTMRENRSAYNRDEKMQARYRELLGARETLKPRSKAA